MRHATPGAPAKTGTAGGSLSLWSAQAFFSALIAVGFANGIAEKAVRSAREVGVAGALLDTFGVSIILWAGCAGTICLLLRAPQQALSGRDLAIAGAASFCFLAPVPAASWPGIILMALYLRWTAQDPENRAAAALALALTIPLFWSRLVFMAVSMPVLSLDAHLVALVVGTKPEGNLVPFADGTGALFLEPGCSSVANLSLALLSASLFLNMRGARWSAPNVAWIGASLFLVLAINVVRIALIGLYPAHYPLIHGPVGVTVAGWLTVAAILLVGYHRIGRDAVAPA